MYPYTPYTEFNPTCSSRLLATHIVDNELMIEARPGERVEMRRMVERELKVPGMAEREVKRITCALKCAFSAWLSGFQFLSILAGYDGKPRQTSSGMKETNGSYFVIEHFQIVFGAAIWHGSCMRVLQ